MSGIYIPGMEMPKSCHECVAGYGGCCFVAPAESDGTCPDHGRADFCPLVPVPDHGDLIDRVAFREEMDKYYPFDRYTQSKHKWEDTAKSAVIKMLATAPTIIPKSGGTEDE